MTDTSADGGHDPDPGLAESLHRVLSTLTRVRQDGLPLAPDVLRQRIELVSWLRQELGAAEMLLHTELRNAQVHRR